MVVDRYGVASTDFSKQVQESGPSTTGVAKSSSSVSPKPAAEDTTSFTSADNSSVQSLTKTALQTIPSRAEKVEALRQAVNSTQYTLDSEKISQSLANSEV